MKMLIAFIIFIIILFFYCHIWYHLKTSDDLEMYEIEKPSKEKLENLIIAGRYFNVLIILPVQIVIVLVQFFVRA